MKKRVKHLLLLSVLIASLFQGFEFTRADDWDYYKEITISNFSASYQKKITVYFGSGSDSTDTVYLNSHCQTDFDDIQFRESDHTTVLKHWKEEYTASTSATFWVKLPASSQTIYIYYGNSGASDSSDPDDVFLFYDGAESGSPGDKWGEQASANGDMEYVTTPKYGDKSLKCTQTSSSTTYYVYRNISEDTFILEYWGKQGATNNYDFVLFFESTNQRLTTRWDNNSDLMYYTSSYQDTGYNYSTNWEFHRFTCTTSDDKIKWEQDETTIATDAHRSAWTAIDQIRIFHGSASYPNDYAYYDDVRIRKYASPEPTFSFGSEQTTNSPPNTPSNTSPSNGASGVSQNPTLQWSTYSDPDSDPQQAWEVQVDNNSDFTSNEWSGSGTTETSVVVNTTNGSFGNDCSGQTKLDSDTYYWRVRHQDNQNNWSNWSTYTNFTTNQPPNTPTNSSPTDQATGISLNPTLEWSAYSDPESDPQQAFEVRIDNNSNFLSLEWSGSGSTGNSVVVNSTNGTFSNDCSGQTELDETEPYYWQARAQDDQGNWSNWSTYTEFTTGQYSPNQPSITSPTDQATGVSLNPTIEWTYSDPNSDPIQNCDVIIDDNSDFSSKEAWTGLMGGGAVTSIVVNTSNFTFYNNCEGQTGLDQSTLYYLKVRVQDDTGRWSVYSAVIEFTTGSTPAAPTGCTATYVSDSQIDLSWTDNSSNETGFQIHRSVDGGGYSQLTTESENSTGSNDTSTSADHYYQYKVRSDNDVGESTFCETSIVYTSPSAPSNVEASKNDSNITLTWTDNSNITDTHEIERSIDGGDWDYLADDSDGTYQDTWQEAWTSVKYRVRAKGTGPRYSSYVESETVTSNQAPTADFTYFGSSKTSITFDARTSTDPDNDTLTYQWDMGNGDTASGDYITYDYDAYGTWDVTLTVSDGELNDQMQKEVKLSGQSSGGPSGGGGITPAEATKQMFETIGEKAKETAKNAKENDATPFIIIIVAIVLIAAFKKK